MSTLTFKFLGEDHILPQEAFPLLPAITVEVAPPSDEASRFSDEEIKGARRIAPPKRAKSRESSSNAFNSLRRSSMDQLAETDYSLMEAWRYGCLLFNYTCYICDGVVENGKVQADHVIPPRHGGSGNAGNMLPVHSKCNTLKGDTHPDLLFKRDPVKLEKLEHLRRRYEFRANPKLYEIAQAITNELEEIHDQKINQAKLAIMLQEERESLGESTEESGGYGGHHAQLRLVQNYMEEQGYSQSGQSKVTTHCRKILTAWESHGSFEEFTQASALELKGFIYELLSQNSGRNAEYFRRAHRAFRVLSEVFEMKALRSIYSNGNPFTVVVFKTV